MKRLEKLLRNTMGLNPESVGVSLVSKSVRARMKNTGAATLEEYLKLAQSSPDELRELTECVVIPETWFFRDRKTFDALAKFVTTEWLPGNPGGAMKLLSVPCSTGEEACSMAMTLLDCGVPPGRFQIDAVDISARALAAAARGVYGRNSFRDPNLQFRERHFAPVKGATGEFQIQPRVRERIRFVQGNLLDRDCLNGFGVYDVIFCRNLLIYFDKDIQKAAVHKLHGLLKRGGVCLFGAAEAPLINHREFHSLGAAMSFAFRKDGPKPKVQSPKPVESPTALDTKSLRSGMGFAVELPALSSAEILEQARRMADAGKLDEAAGLCNALLQKDAASAQAYFLLGLVNDAAGIEARAGEFYRKALYLQPDHYEALMQMASLARKKGQPARAALFQQRARRARERIES